MISIKSLSIVSWSTLFGLLGSCSGNTYILNAPNPSFLGKKGEKQVQCQLGSQGIQPQMAIALTNKVGCQINGDIGFHGQTYLEGMGGLYLNGKRFCLETYGGAGYGSSDYQFSYKVPLSYNSKDLAVFSDYIKVPLQVNLGYHKKRNRMVFLSTRLSFIHLMHYNYTNVDHYANRSYGYTILSTEAHATDINGFIWDVGLGLKIFNVIIQMGGSYNGFQIPHHNTIANTYSHNQEDLGFSLGQMDYFPGYLSVGYSFRFKSKQQ